MSGAVGGEKDRGVADRVLEENTPSWEFEENLMEGSLTAVGRAQGPVRCIKHQGLLRGARKL